MVYNLNYNMIKELDYDFCRDISRACISNASQYLLHSVTDEELIPLSLIILKYDYYAKSELDQFNEDLCKVFNTNIDLNKNNIKKINEFISTIMTKYFSNSVLYECDKTKLNNDDDHNIYRPIIKLSRIFSHDFRLKSRVDIGSFDYTWNLKIKVINENEFYKSLRKFKDALSYYNDTIYCNMFRLGPLRNIIRKRVSNIIDLMNIVDYNNVHDIITDTNMHNKYLSYIDFYSYKNITTDYGSHSTWWDFNIGNTVDYYFSKVNDNIDDQIYDLIHVLIVSYIIILMIKQSGFRSGYIFNFMELSQRFFDKLNSIFCAEFTYYKFDKDYNKIIINDNKDLILFNLDNDNYLVGDYNNEYEYFKSSFAKISPLSNSVYFKSYFNDENDRPTITYNNNIEDFLTELFYYYSNNCKFLENNSFYRSIRYMFAGSSIDIFADEK